MFCGSTSRCRGLVCKCDCVIFWSYSLFYIFRIKVGTRTTSARQHSHFWTRLANNLHPRFDKKIMEYTVRPHGNELVLYWPFQDGASLVGSFVIYVARCLIILSCLLLAALWSPFRKGLTSWLSSVRFFLVFWHLIIRCLGLGGNLLYRFLIFAFFTFVLNATEHDTSAAHSNKSVAFLSLL